MWKYEANVDWSAGRAGIMRSANKPEIPVAAPPEFGGPQEGSWTPEDLLATSVASCIMTTALFFIERGKIVLRSYGSKAAATMEKTPSGLAITGIALDISITLENPEQESALRQAMERAEKNCPISAVLKCPVEIALHIRP